jgi:hypothetical protein
MSFVPLFNNAVHRKDLNLTEPWTPRIKEENEALPPSISFWDQPVYTPPKDEYVRPGALDFKKIKSKDI